MLIPWYLMAAYAYYIEDNPIISDLLFDQWSKDLIENWNTLDHIHKEYISLDDLEAGTFLGKYPTRVKHALKYVRNQETKLKGTLEDFFN